MICCRMYLDRKQDFILIYREGKLMEETTQVIKYQIVRRTSDYNKYIKWFVECFRYDGSLLSSTGYKTRKDAKSSVRETSRSIPIGNRLVKTIYQEL